jgi:hypothetical protein
MLCKVLVSRSEADNRVPDGGVRHADARYLSEPEVGVESPGKGRGRDFKEETVASYLFGALAWQDELEISGSVGRVRQMRGR